MTTEREDKSSNHSYARTNVGSFTPNSSLHLGEVWLSALLKCKAMTHWHLVKGKRGEGADKYHSYEMPQKTEIHASSMSFSFLDVGDQRG